MTYHYKARIVWGRCMTRKDWHHKASGYGWAYYNKKRIRKTANQAVRNYKGDISNGGHYKKIYDVVYTVF